MTWRLPALLRWSANPLWLLVYWTPLVLVYQVVNRVPLVAPRELAFTALDDLVPFVPALLPLYVAYLPFYWWTGIRMRTDRELNEFFYRAHALLLLSLPFFVCFPVRMPLERFYPPAPLGAFDALWRWFDAPQNCFPSLHVSTCLLLLECHWRRPRRVLHAAVALGIAASTVFVKQHYVVDVAGGIAAYAAARLLLWRVEIEGPEPEGRVATPARPAPRTLATWRPAGPPREVS